MYAAHFALGLAVKSHERRIPTWAALTAVSLADLVFACLALLGIETVRVAPGAFPGVAAENIGWSHSICSGLVLGLAFAPFARRGMRPFLLLVTLTASHALMDAIMHPWVLPWFPGATTGLGFGLWHRMPLGWWFIEGAIVAVGLAYYWHRTSHETVTHRRRANRIVAVVTILHLLSFPAVHQISSQFLFERLNIVEGLCTKVHAYAAG